MGGPTQAQTGVKPTEPDSGGLPPADRYLSTNISTQYGGSNLGSTFNTRRCSVIVPGVKDAMDAHQEKMAELKLLQKATSPGFDQRR